MTTFKMEMNLEVNQSPDVGRLSQHYLTVSGRVKIGHFKTEKHPQWMRQDE